ncbi:GNAT family N-acetyltransferase [Sneathiella sp. HT1-7]|uniref:GNAT family N-acetyltransferase n=1 Tax=Sneathiella sp. HT1-7 TaxID=2887192 RepID=UPI001D152017|nr:N-acetyltransferase [Sneathiella sp. HT1-7]MCC3305374.1 N-acetyltransferase [Sneathiella sp. HT1-7]
MSLPLRQERPDDAPAIHALITAAFGQEDEANLVDALRQDGDLWLSLVMEGEDGEIIGHIALSRLKSPKNALALAPVSVTPKRQGEGIGGALIRRAIKEARSKGKTLIFVLGDPAYYTRLGFNVETAAPFDCIYAGDYFMALELGDEKAEVAPVVYADAFGRLG